MGSGGIFGFSVGDMRRAEKYAKNRLKKRFNSGPSFFLGEKEGEKRGENFFFLWCAGYTPVLRGVAQPGKMGFEPTHEPSPRTCLSMGGRLKQTNTHIAG